MPAVDDLKSLDRLDQVVLGAGVLAFIVSFFPFYGYSYHVAGFGGSYNVSAWHSIGVLGVLLIIVATLLAAARIFAPTAIPTMPVGVALLTFALAALGTLVLVLRAVTYHHGTGFAIKWGGYLMMILVIVETVAAYMVFKKSGEAMPDFAAMNAQRQAAAAANASAAPTAPPAVYPPTPATPAGDFTMDDSPAEPPSF